MRMIGEIDKTSICKNLYKKEFESMDPYYGKIASKPKTDAKLGKM